ncbi:hypothetical protein TCAL_12921 [Tigriopus californicus]|uniref:Chitin-binding type-2 domain-containing protein n=1 Tax=Tigriopus californicus TaxID=6832 RepID=A0A553PJG8_TIGCA|nr:hypothetical protein TCAL_12921 [Tigriopus californicus]
MFRVGLRFRTTKGAAEPQTFRRLFGSVSPISSNCDNETFVWIVNHIHIAISSSSTMAQLIFLLILSLDVAFGIEKVRQGDLNEDGKDDREPKMFSHKTTGRDFSSTQDSTVLSILREDDQTYENVISGFSCRSRQQGYYPEVRTSCSIYYLCYHQRGSDMLRITFVCPEGYKYDPNSYQCRKGYVVNCQVGFAPLREQPKLMKNPIPFDVNNEFYIDDPGHFPGKSSKSYKLNSRYDFNYKPENPIELRDLLQTGNRQLVFKARSSHPKTLDASDYNQKTLDSSANNHYSTTLDPNYHYMASSKLMGCHPRPIRTS